MALFTDGTAVSIDDLAKYDSSLLDVSAVEGVNLTAKLALAHDEVGIELHSLLERTWTNYSFSVAYRRPDVRNVVVNGPVRLWQVYQTLAMVYRDAYFNQLNDRYQAKWKEYASLAGWAMDKVQETGLAMVTDPVAQPAPPSVTSVAAAENGGTYYFAVSYVNAAGEEGQACASVTITTTDGSAADLLPSNPPPNVTGWNCYAGTTPELLYMQNPSPLDPTLDFTYYPSLAATSGTLPGNGQTPNFHEALPRLLQRG